MLASFVTFWMGPRLGPVERACLKSAVRHGNPLALYCYEEPQGVPAGVEVRDAAEILPRSRVIHHHTGSVSLFSNLFRYELQRLGKGVWTDCDAYMLAPLHVTSPYLLGEHAPGQVSTGVLRFPADSPLIKPLMAVFEEKEVPFWISRRARLAARWRLLTTGKTGIAYMPWGSAGPVALTALVKKFGLEHLVLPPEVLYPVNWPEADWIRDPAIRLEDKITPRTVSLHLYNELIKGFKELPAPKGSFLERLQEEGA